MTRASDPRRLDVEAVAGEGATLEGEWPLAGFERLAESTVDKASSADGEPVRWQVIGARRRSHAGGAESWLHLRARTSVRLECQRCLEAMTLPLDVDREIRFVPGEDAAAALDADDDAHDVLATSRALDLHSLVEDELLLALPIVPRHAVCPAPLVVAETGQADHPNPFAMLAGWRRDGPET